MKMKGLFFLFCLASSLSSCQRGMPLKTAKFPQEFWQLKSESGDIIKSSFLNEKQTLKDLQKKYPKSKIENNYLL